MVSTTKVQIIPQLTTLERDALVSPVDGTLIYNTDVGVNQTYNGSTWIDNAAGTLSLQTAYDGGSVINMDSNVNLEVFSTTSDLAFSVIENGSLSGIQCNRALQIDYPGIGGPILFFQHLTPTAPGNLIINIGGQTQASNGFSKIFETLQVQVVNDSDAAFEAETIFKNIINNSSITCFSTGVENKSFRSLNMNSNQIINQDNITFIDNAILENVNNGFSLRNSRDAAIDNIFIAPSENIFYKNINLQSGVNITFPFANNSIGSPTTGLLDNLWVNNINRLTPVGGLSSGTSNSTVLTASTAEQSILSNTFVGSRTAPANIFQQGDAFTAILAGNFSSSNGDTLTLRLKGGPTGTDVLSSIVIPLNNSSGVYFEIEIDFLVRQIGGPTVADLAINYDFSYNQASGGNFQGQRLCQVNNTTFDTTVLNTLDITAQFSSNSASNSIETLLSTLGKTY